MNIHYKPLVDFETLSNGPGIHAEVDCNSHGNATLDILDAFASCERSGYGDIYFYSENCYLLYDTELLALIESFKDL